MSNTGCTKALRLHRHTSNAYQYAVSAFYSMQQNQDVLLEVAQRLLFMPDLFSYYLTGVANNEYCIASTSELLDAHQRNWSMDTIRTLGLPEHLFGEIILPGTVRGTLKEEIGRETGLGDRRHYRCRLA
ncbi:FGGY family carbohydrate kinase [Bacteroides thetaiotaomicron]|nr:FGGY family carbohydrate kinase [Bacteroides thetaiotaomicron]